MEHRNDERWKTWLNDFPNKELFYEMERHEVIQDLLLKYARSDWATLEVGSGSGMNSAFASKFVKEAHVLDISEDALALSRKIAGLFGTKLSTIKGDIRNIPCEQKFDLVFTCGTLQYFKDEQMQIWQELIRVSKELIIVDVPYRYSPFNIRKNILIMLGKWPWGREGSFSKHELKRWVKKMNLQILELHGRELDAYARALLNIDYYLQQGYVPMFIERILSKLRPGLLKLAIQLIPQDIVIVCRKFKNERNVPQVL